jgi:hypothetical protein
MSEDELELTEEEQHLIETARQRGLPPAELLGRAARDLEREETGGQPAERPAAKTPPQEKPLTAAEAEKLLNQREQQREQQRQIAAAKADMVATIDSTIQEDPAFKDAPETVVVALQAEAFNRLRGDKRFASMNQREIKAALQKATKEAMADHAKWRDGKTGEADRAELERRAEVIEKSGEPAGAGRSAGTGSDEPPPDEKFWNREYGPVDQDFNLSDAEIDHRAQKEAEAMLRKLRGKKTANV